MTKWQKPYGYLTSGDIAQISGLRGMQVRDFLYAHGVEIDGRMVIRETYFRELEKRGKLLEYRGRPTWTDKIRKKGNKNDI